jgi:hypothetical protein
LKLFIKTFTLVLSQVSGFISAVLGYEAFRIYSGAEYNGGLLGLDIPFVYQTKEIYSQYCLWLCIWLFMLCIAGVLFSLRNKRIAALVTGFIIIITLFVIVYLNGRYT